MKVESICVCLVLCFAAAVSQVFNSNFRGVNRINPYLSRDRNPSFTRFFPRRHHGKLRRRRPAAQTKADIGQTSALRAGKEGSYDFTDQHNAILPVRKFGKPTKAPPASNPNKINIETPLASSSNTRDIQVERVVLGSTAILHCTFDNVVQVGTYKQAQIWWTKLPQKGGDRPTIMAAGTQIRLPDDRLSAIAAPDNQFSILVIKNVIEQDMGEYKCSLPTVTGTLMSFNKLEVKEQSNENIVTSPQDNVVMVGQSLNLFCRPENSNLGVWWTAKDDDGNSIDIDHGFDKLQGVSLSVSRMRRYQAGVYTCHVENPTGKPYRRHFNVQVKEAPWDITAYENGFQTDSVLSRQRSSPLYGDNVNLRCDSGGVPVPTINWYKDGRLIAESSKYTIFSYEPSYKDNAVTGKLTINSFTQSDDGVYKCEAINDSGSSQHSFNVEGYYNRQASVDDEEDDYSYGSQALRGRRGRFQIIEGSGGVY